MQNAKCKLGAVILQIAMSTLQFAMAGDSWQMHGTGSQNGKVKSSQSSYRIKKTLAPQAGDWYPFAHLPGKSL
jgi:hypothetical protein